MAAVAVCRPLVAGRGFKRETLERALLRGDVLKPTVMRGTLHLVTARDYPLFWTALRDMPTVARPRASIARRRCSRCTSASSRRSESAHARGRLAYLEREHGLVEAPGDARRHALAVAARHHCTRRRAALWPAAPTAVSSPHREPGPSTTLAAARTSSCSRYLAAFGPATRADIADWSGLRVRRLRARARCSGRPTYLDEHGRHALRPAARAAARGRHARARALPPEVGQLLLGHADRSACYRRAAARR